MKHIADFFDALADRWDELCYHDPQKLNYILKQSGLRQSMRILDVGCGTGILESYLLAHAPSKIVAVDLSPRMIKQAQLKYHTPLVDFRSMDVLDLKNEIFDYIIVYSAFPHFEYPEILIAHLAELTSPGGKLIICHSEGRVQINGHHDKQAKRISFPLLKIEQVKSIMRRFFTIDKAEDTDQLYLICGTRKETIIRRNSNNSENKRYRE
ncbi:class I SAM-dependent methyltransferase [Parabacteroides sp. AM08-6]|uniref:class I SAM-dependent methyltransferase n=1 Tax=Parabacteroides sp. AM08-6 TaxID=2292053 RepID=UPI000EFE18C4|nr:class I SAM-dependent methyltransferase [Parabacteroides sp. AM08-6]RHJ87868.1 class I SAM-dependent methyltransferase [Parabacteroides sp. AM08-6]